MQTRLIGIIAFIIIFGIIVAVHEFGHFYFAKKSGILVREFSIGMGPKLFSNVGKDGTLYSIRMIPVGGYVRMAGWGDDETDIKKGSLASLTLDDNQVVKRINLSDKHLDPQALPLNITDFDFENRLEISGRSDGELQTYTVDHDATIVEEDGTELRIAPADVRYNSASLLGRMITNFAGPMNNFILGIFVFVLVVFLQGGVSDLSSNQVTVSPNGAIAQSGIQTGDKITKINGITIRNWTELSQTVTSETKDSQSPTLKIQVQHKGETKTVSVVPKESDGRYLIGVSPIMKTGFKDKVFGGLQMAWNSAFAILQALKNLLFHPSLNKLGGPVAIYQLSSQAANQGLVTLLQLMAMLSINLGLMNLIPIPALDGGKILINIIEAIRRKPMKESTESYITLVGVAFMFILMIAVTWNDIMRIFFK